MYIATNIDIHKIKTLVCDIMDMFGPQLKLLDPIFKDFGQAKVFHGFIKTVKCFEDNSRVHEVIGQPGNGQILVIDGGGSLRHSLLGGNLAVKAHANGWAGIIVNGAVRDSAELEEVALGVKALAPCPRASIKKGAGECDVEVHFAGQSILPGEYLYADQDGIVIAQKPLHT